MLKNFMIATALAGALVAADQANVAVAAEEQYFPMLVYRTGPYGGNGAQLANGGIDYLKLMNRQGGVNGVTLTWEECEYGYKTDLGVECYERLKGNGKVAAVTPFSTGVTYALLESTRADENVLFTMGYGRTSAADGRVFPYVFNFPATYWSQATSMMAYVAEQEGGMDKLAGKTIALVHLDHPYGREPIPTLDAMAAEHGFEVALYPVPPTSMTDQKSIWLDIRRTKPDWILMWGWGAMNPTAIKEASLVRYPMDRFIGNWWSGAEVDTRGSGVPAEGYIAANFHSVGTEAPVFEALKAMHADGEGTGPADEIGEVLYNRGLVNSAYIVEAMITAQKKFGNRALSGAEMQWGFENLDITEERIAELGLTGLLPPTKVTCDNHEGAAPAVKLQQWDGEKWNVISDWIAADTELLRPMIEADAAQYATENNIEPRSCS